MLGFAFLLIFFNISLIQSVLNCKHTTSQIEKSHVFPVNCNMLMDCMSLIQSLFFKLNNKSHTEMLRWIYYNWLFNLLKANSTSDGQQLDNQNFSLATSCILLGFLQLWQNFLCPELTGLRTYIILFLCAPSFYYSFFHVLFFSFLSFFLLLIWFLPLHFFSSWQFMKK